MALRRAFRSLLRFAFRLFYNPFAFTYDFVSVVVSRGQWREWTRAAIPRIVGTRVLEVPCGTGNLLLDLAAAGYHPVGVDLSASMIRITQAKMRKAEQGKAQHAVPLDTAPSVPQVGAQHVPSPGAQYIAPLLARVEELPFGDAAFDSIVMTFPPGFVYDPRALGELRRVLDENGRLIWVDAGRLVPRGFWNRALNYALDKEAGGGEFEAMACGVLSRAGFECNVETVKNEHSIVKVATATKRKGR